MQFERSGCRDGVVKMTALEDKVARAYQEESVDKRVNELEILIDHYFFLANATIDSDKSKKYTDIRRKLQHALAIELSQTETTKRLLYNRTEDLPSHSIYHRKEDVVTRGIATRTRLA